LTPDRDGEKQWQEKGAITRARTMHGAFTTPLNPEKGVSNGRAGMPPMVSSALDQGDRKMSGTK